MVIGNDMPGTARPTTTILVASQADVVHETAAADVESIDLEEGGARLGVFQIGLEVAYERAPSTVGRIHPEPESSVTLLWSVPS